MNTFALIAAGVFLCYVLFSLMKVRADSSLADCIHALSQSKSTEAENALRHIRLFVLDSVHQRHHKLHKRRSKISLYLTRAVKQDPGLKRPARALIHILANY